MKLVKVSIPLLLAAVAVGCASPERKTAGLDAELDEITALWSGDFAGEATMPGADDKTTIVHRIVPILAPQFGERVFLYQLHRESAAGPLLQQKIFAFDTNPSRAENRMRAWVFAPDRVDAAVGSEPADWRAMQPGELKDFPESCAFRWRETRAGFSGRVSAKDCRFASRAFGQAIRPDMSYGLTRNSLTWDETLSADDGESLVSTGGPLTAARVGPVVAVWWEFYAVQGDTFAQIRRDLSERIAVDTDGEARESRTEWNLRWSIGRSETEIGCAVDGVEVRLDVSHLLPRLDARNSLPAEVKDAWDAYADTLLEHELRHRRLAVEA
ncbi:MAG: DUF922 domain-containing protein, partial [Gammaproteobacteria bacterium]